MIDYLAVAFAAFMVGYLVGSKERVVTVRSAVVQQFGGPSHAKSAQGQAVPRAIPAFQLRPRFVQRRATWEAKHNTKAQMNASIAEQIRRAQEGTLT